jgi:hypothetical protein
MLLRLKNIAKEYEISLSDILNNLEFFEEINIIKPPKNLFLEREVNENEWDNSLLIDYENDIRQIRQIRETREVILNKDLETYQASVTELLESFRNRLFIKSIFNDDYYRRKLFNHKILSNVYIINYLNEDDFPFVSTIYLEFDDPNILIRINYKIFFGWADEDDIFKKFKFRISKEVFAQEANTFNVLQDLYYFYVYRRTNERYSIKEKKFKNPYNK